MPTSTYVVVMCPSCGEEVKLRFRKVEVAVDDYLIISNREQEPLNLRADVVAEGAHHCEGSK